jgi:hypothetical protein
MSHDLLSSVAGRGAHALGRETSTPTTTPATGTRDGHSMVDPLG